jgi:hypothetical protein
MHAENVCKVPTVKRSSQNVVLLAVIDMLKINILHGRINSSNNNIAAVVWVKLMVVTVAATAVPSCEDFTA